MFFDWLMNLLPEFHGDIRIFLAMVYFAMGAFVLLHAYGASKYYTRQWHQGQEPTVMLFALILCILLWPILMTRKDVSLPRPKLK